MGKSTKDLYDILKNKFKIKDELSRNKILSYVIYARKSTEEKDKQVGSIDDQVKVCEEFALKNNLYVKDRITESKSAKYADIRDGFKKMITGLKHGKYDGIIAWHPDRLARNMKDAGEIIDMLDKEEILDLKFPSFTFVNDPSGKMNLGIVFVLSKQYSDQLSSNVQRGNRQKMEQGYYVNTAKHGYKKIDRRLYPDEKNFHLIKNAFEMRVRGKSLQEIADYLNNMDYKRYSVKDDDYISFN